MMKRAIASLLFVVGFAACASTSGDAFPPPIIPSRPSASDWPDAGAAVLEDVVTLEYRIIGGQEGAPRKIIAVLDHRRRMKVLSEAGLAQAKVALRIDAFSTVTRVVARSVHPNGAIVEMASHGVVPAPIPGIEKSAEAKELHFSIPDPRVGGLLEYRYQRVFVDPHFVPVWSFGGPLPVARAEFGILASEDLRVDARFGRGTRVEDRMPMRRKYDDGRERLLYVETDLPAYHHEPNMPHFTRIGPWVAVVLTGANFGGQRMRLDTWDAVAERLTELAERVGGDPGTGSAERRFQQVRDSITPLPLAGLGVRKPVSAVGIERGEPTCTRDAAAYLYAKLKGSGVKHYLAYLTGPTGPNAPQDFPGLYPFTRAVIAVDVREANAKDSSCHADPVKRGLLCTVPPDSYAFLDPLCSKCRYGELPTELTGGRAMVLLDEGPRWVDVPIDPPERNRLMTQLKLELDVKGIVRGGISGEVAGAAARRLRTGLETVESGDPRDRALTEGIVGTKSPVTFTAGSYSNALNVDLPLRFRARVQSKVRKVGFERFEIGSADLAGPSMPGEWRKMRRFPMIFEAPSWVETVVALQLPVGYEVEAPPMITVVKPFAEYAAGFVRRERVLNYSRRLVLKQQIISPAEWESFRSFIEQIDEIERRAVRVRIGDGG